METRSFREEDRGAVVALLGRPEAVDSAAHHVVVVEEDGAVVGAGVAGDGAAEGYRVLSIALAAPGRLDVLDALMRSLIGRGLALGYRKGYARVHDRALMELMRRRYGFDVAVVGRDGRTGEATVWELSSTAEALSPALLGA